MEPPSLVAVEFLSAAIIHIAGGELLHIICDLWLTYPPEKNMKARLDHHLRGISGDNQQDSTSTNTWHPWHPWFQTTNQKKLKYWILDMFLLNMAIYLWLIYPAT